MPDSFSQKLNFTQNGVQYSAIITRENGETSLLYTSPDALDGLKLTKSADGIHSEFLGLESPADSGAAGESSAVYVLSEILDSIYSGNYEASVKDGIIFLSSANSSLKFNGSLSSDGTKILYLYAPGYALKAEFAD